MATLSMSGPGDGKKKKLGDVQSVDACPDGDCLKPRKAKMSLSTFNPTKKRYNIGVTPPPPPPDIKEGALHSNQLNLGDEAGQVNYSGFDPKTGKKTASVVSEQKAATSERAATKAKEDIGKTGLRFKKRVKKDSYE